MNRFSASVIQPTSRVHLGRIFFQRVSELGERTFLKVQRLGGFEDISWRDFGAMGAKHPIRSACVPINKADNVAIVSDNSLPRLCADLARLAGGLPNVVIAPTVSDRTLLKILTHSRCRVVFIDLVAAHRVLALKSQLPNLSHVIVLKGGAEELARTISFAELLEQGRRCQRLRSDIG